MAKRRRRLFNPTGGQIAAVTGAAILAGWGIMKVRKRKKKKRAPSVSCAPYRWDPAPVSASIRAEIEDGATDANVIAVTVANEHFGTYPAAGGGTVVFPPQAGAPAGVQCVWDNTVALVGTIINEIGLQPKPWEVVEEWSSDEPTPGRLFRVQPNGWGVADLAREALKNAGIPNEPNANGVYINQLAMRNLIECSPWNDALYGKEGAGGQGGPNGRGLGLVPRYADNLTRMQQGLSPTSSGHGTLPFVWIPLVDPSAPIPMVGDWSDGRSGINPPAQVLAFGVEAPQRIYGCEEYADAAGELQFA